jgi:Sec-independent protein translocase protein TatA
MRVWMLMVLIAAAVVVTIIFAPQLTREAKGLIRTFKGAGLERKAVIMESREEAEPASQPPTDQRGQ